MIQFVTWIIKYISKENFIKIRKRDIGFRQIILELGRTVGFGIIFMVIAWHKAPGFLSWIDRKSIKITCKLCGKESQTKTYHQEFCSNPCKSKWRRKDGLDNITKICPICNKEFVSNKYSKKETCGRSCAGKLRWKYVKVQEGKY